MPLSNDERMNEWEWLENARPNAQSVYDVKALARGSNPDRPNTFAQALVGLAYRIGVYEVLRAMHGQGVGEDIINRFGYVVRGGELTEAGAVPYTEAELANINAINGGGR